MGRIVVLVTAALGLSASMVLGSKTGFNCVDDIRTIGPRGHPEPACTASALGYLGCRRRLSPECVSEVSSQIVGFCGRHVANLSTVVSTVTTSATEVVTSTLTETDTTETTIVETETSVTETTTTEISSFTSTSTSTTTVATSFVPPSSAVSVAVKKRGQTGACPDVTRLLARIRSSKLSSICSCFGATESPQKTSVTTKTVLATSTATDQETETTTSTTTTTTVEVLVTTTTTTTSTTTTTGTVASATAVVDYCSLTYNGGGVTPGNTVIRPPGDLDGRQCCELCWSTPNCVASATGLGYCQLLVKTSPLEGAPTSLQCPLGIENYPYQEGPGTLYRGPCSPGLN